MRAAVYARYSSENQREASIEDQVRLCTAKIEAEGWLLTRTYADHAQSGASRLRRRGKRVRQSRGAILTPIVPRVKMHITEGG